MRIQGKNILAEKNIASLTSNLVLAVAGFLSFILLSRNIAPALFGSWLLYLALSGFADLIRIGVTKNAVIHLGSGNNLTHTHTINAGGLTIQLFILAAIMVLFWGTYLFGHSFLGENIRIFLLLYPLQACSNITQESSVTFLQASEQYHKVISVKLISTLLFLMLCGFMIYRDQITLLYIIGAFIFANFCSSVYCRFRGWDSLNFIKKVSREQLRKTWSFGKYSFGSVISSNLLKSADTYIIGLSPLLGTTGIAIYSIPFKIIDILEVPIRSLSLAAFNKISVTFKQNDTRASVRLFTKYNILLWFLILPALLFILIFPEFMLQILGGKNYLPYWDTMTTVLYIALIYGFLLVPDRLLGVMLEGIGYPKANLIKTILMAACNIVGNLIAVFYFRSIPGVAVASVFFTIIGIIAGERMLPAHYKIRLKDILQNTNAVYQDITNLLKKSMSK